MASFSSSAFLTDAFSDQAFDFGVPTPVVTTVGGHFAGRRKRRREEDVSASAEAKARLREDIRLAIEGPQHISEAVASALEPFTRAQATDARLVPLDERIDWGMLDRHMAAIDRALTAAIRQAIEDDDDEDLLLLNG